MTATTSLNSHAGAMGDDLTNEMSFIPSDLLLRFKVTETDLDHVRRLGDQLLPELTPILTDFSVWTSQQREFEAMAAGDDERTQMFGMLMDYWRELFRGRVDEQYVDSRLTVGEFMARVGIPVVMYVAGMSRLRDEFTARVQHEPTEVRQSLNRMIMLDIALVAECYPIVMNRRIAAQSRSLTEMSTPVTELWDRVLMLPLVGIIDSHRAHQVMTSVLNRIAETRARAFIMDISGVSVVDTAVANHLISIAKASRLMGCTALLSGVSPEIAGTVVALGIDVGDLRTHATLQDALGHAFSLIGVEVSKPTLQG